MNDLKEHFTRQQICILIGVISMFLPFYICASIIVFLTIYLIIKGDIQNAYKKTSKSQFIIYFCILISIVSFVYKNYIGLLCSICLLFFLLFILFYRIHTTKELFELIVDIVIIMSLFAAIYGIIEYIRILNAHDIHTFKIIIYNRPQDRINSMYFNANYYAMMIEFFVCLAFYKILKLKNGLKEYKKFIFYVSTIIINLLMLVLTACRTAWPALAISIMIMLIVDKRYKICGFILACVLFVCIYFLFNPSKFPRVNNIIAYFLTRQNIWKTAIANIKTHPLFGEGPMTYMHIYKQYHGHKTQHAHSVYLDPLLSFGIIGLTVIAPYVISNITKIYYLIKRKLNPTLSALIIACIVVVLIHGTMDYTIFFVQTGLLFLIIVSSFDIYKESLQ